MRKGKNTSARPSFSVDWFSEHIPVWERFLLAPAWRRTRKGGIKALLIGAYEGRIVQWLMNNVMTDASRDVATVVEDFAYESCVGFKGRPVWNPPANVKRVFEATIEPFKDQVRMNPPDADDHLYDIVYIDAHDSIHALECGVHAMSVLRPGGILIFQNYVHNREHDTACPRVGIDAFLATYVRYIKIMNNGFHLFVQRRSRAEELPKRSCHSEYYPLPEHDKPICDHLSKTINRTP